MSLFATVGTVTAGNKIKASEYNTVSSALNELKLKYTILAKSADYTILDTDPDIIEVTTGATDRTITLPTLADNIGRKIKIVKVDDGAGNVTIDGEGAETIDGVTTIDIDSRYDMAVFEAGASCWNLEKYKDHGSNANGSWERFADGTMRQWGKITFSSVAVETAWGSGFVCTPALSISFPKTYNTIQTFIPSVVGSTYGGITYQGNTSFTTSAASFSILRMTTLASGDYDIAYTTEGRWRA